MVNTDITVKRQRKVCRWMILGIHHPHGLVILSDSPTKPTQAKHFIPKNEYFKSLVCSWNLSLSKWRDIENAQCTISPHTGIVTHDGREKKQMRRSQHQTHGLKPKKEKRRGNLTNQTKWSIKGKEKAGQADAWWHRGHRRAQHLSLRVEMNSLGFSLIAGFFPNRFKQSFQD